MELLNILAPKMADQTVYEGDGGGYYSWSTSATPFLGGDAKLAAGKLILRPLGFALPHYASSNKIGYVLQGSCVVGIIPRDNPTEKVVKITKGDVIPLVLGTVSWWYNDSNSDSGSDSDSDILKVIFLGDSKTSHTEGQFNYHFITGSVGILSGFSTEFLTKGFGITQTESNTFFKSQTASVITKLKHKLNIAPDNDSDIDSDNAALVFNLENKGGVEVTIKARDFPLLGPVQLSVNRVRLEPGSMLTPVYTADSSNRLGYVCKGSALVQIVGPNGQLVLDSKVNAGQLFSVPKFFVFSLVADTDGIELVSIVTSSEPIFGSLAGVESVWKALSPSILQASLNLDTNDSNVFETKIVKRTS